MGAPCELQVCVFEEMNISVCAVGLNGEGLKVHSVVQVDLNGINSYTFLNICLVCLVSLQTNKKVTQFLHPPAPPSLAPKSTLHTYTRIHTYMYTHIVLCFLE